MLRHLPIILAWVILGIIPYYTVNSGYTTGVSVINTSASTQVSEGALASCCRFDGRAGFQRGSVSLRRVGQGMSSKNRLTAKQFNEIRFYSNDESCVVPDFTNENYFVMPDTFRIGAEEGYIEIMGMGQTYQRSPADCYQCIARCRRHPSELRLGFAITSSQATMQMIIGETTDRCSGASRHHSYSRCDQLCYYVAARY